jgi:hypothetical protein
MFWTQKMRPRAREEGLLIEHVNDETVIFDTESREAHCLSPLAALVFEHCDGRTSSEGLAGIASEHLSEPVEPWQVDDALDRLQECKLLAVSAPRSEGQGGTTRRQAIKRSAVTGGVLVAAPLITSVFPPAAAAAGSATCGGPSPLPTVLCCPCKTGSGANKDECCQPPFTNKCTCTSAQGDSTKFCHPAGQPSGHDAVCGPGGADRPPCAQCCANQTAGGCGNLLGNGTNANNNCIGGCPGTCAHSTCS